MLLNLKMYAYCQALHRNIHNTSPAAVLTFDSTGTCSMFHLNKESQIVLSVLRVLYCSLLHKYSASDSPLLFLAS